MDSRNFINHVVSNLSDKQADKLAALLSFAQHPVSTFDLLHWADVDTYKIDSAHPVDYAREIEKIYPNSINARYVYDYRTANFGALLNVNDVFTSAFLSFIKSIKL